ncbi:MAG: PEP-CTERM sorting domain-containing protein [Phycisphaerae bacterium]
MRRSLFLLALAGGTLASAGNAAQVGYVQDFNSGLGGFGGNSSSYVVVPSGGVGGAGDGFLEVTNTFPSNLGTRTTAAEFTGNLTADGVTGFSVWLKDTDNFDDLEIHVGVGASFLNFWLYTVPFYPTSEWTEHFVDLSDTANWVQTIGSGTFADALANSDRLLIRHDLAPFMQDPDNKAGDFAIDRVTVLPEPSSLALLAVVGLLAGARHRRR